ncbi:hypothetical protein CCAX7_63410 [Capsulimonas corticalis]|uniref:Uncharacterized protein n=1 Tax=Capsulimonas corticalis TaxID=2219043 RepID=A0A402CWZ1_9BACT|nr:SWIM zinc finger family protein [Capsulimonas corticalis]BDI34290.1 hypothetical protein CCAX7_63410 [Capsulimonas corticalis]
MPSLQAQEWEQTYVYRRESMLSEASGRPVLSLITTAGQDGETGFFRGAVLHPKRTSDLLLSVVDVVQSRFHTPAAMLAKKLLESDPVITCGAGQIRFEGFSSCGGVYARLDLLPNAMHGDFFGSGTTNVNINSHMRAALSRVRENTPLEMTVGSEGFLVHSEGEATIERKVTLPARWLRGFVEAQACQARMEPRLDVSGPEFRKFLRELPRDVKNEIWISKTARGLRMSSQPGADAVCVGGASRLRLLEAVARHALDVRVYAPAAGGGCAWELTTPDSRLVLVLSPDTWRGFSGEGQVLETLAAPAAEHAMGAVKAALRWQKTIVPAALAAESGVDQQAIAWALAQCSASGLVGYDLHQRAYFHRELPFDRSKIPAHQPRLKDAGKLLLDAGVTIESATNPVKAWVRSKDVEYRVIFTEDGAACTCVWSAKHHGERGPCKHILAVQMALVSESPTQE